MAEYEMLTDIIMATPLTAFLYSIAQFLSGRQTKFDTDFYRAPFFAFAIRIGHAFQHFKDTVFPYQTAHWIGCMV
jgi:hypothetical protein